MTARHEPSRVQAAIAEAVGTAMLLAIVIGSGVMAERLSAGNAAVALIGNTLATACGLYVLIELIGPISGAHFNPLVSAALVVTGRLKGSVWPVYVVAQCVGAVAGAVLAHAMFDLPWWQVSVKVRAGAGQGLAEGVATAGLIFLVLRAPARRASILVALWIASAYWFTASTSFANPAAVLGRMLSDTFAGIAPASVPHFLLGEGLGAALGVALALALRDRTRDATPADLNEAADHHGAR